ncbi:MAG TPA: hypothetical protein VM598_09480 [Bdellovibrionota bacterium]|nr:hypothetical protein [Bdellovibrionota bacterium]
MLHAIGLGFLAVLISNPALGAEKEDWLIVPGERVGKILPSSTEAELRSAYGKENVEPVDVHLGEGEIEKGTVLFAKDPKKRIKIVWNDSKKKAHPVRIQLDDGPSAWKTAEGVSVGTTLKELEKINGKAFVLTGFAWDYSGTVIHWNEGKLHPWSELSGRIILRLSPSDDARKDEETYGSVLGDRDIPSSHAAMQKLNPKVYQLIVEMMPKPGPGN